MNPVAVSDGVLIHEPSEFERCCGWSPTQPRSVEEQVHGPSACAKRNEALHEPSNEHAAPTELDECPRGVGGYRHGAPTELFKMVHGHSAHSSNVEALHEPSNKHAAPTELEEGP